MEGDKVSVDRVINAPASAIFAIVADASRHPEIDGSGSVVKLKAGSEHLTLGSTFGMSMKMGVPYSMSNTVIEFEPDRRIAWQTSLSGPWAASSGGGSGATSSNRQTVARRSPRLGTSRRTSRASSCA